jgi:ABC-type uncharacterized transport system auxiliary subunit
MKRTLMIVLPACIILAAAGCSSPMQEKRYYLPDINRTIATSTVTYKDVVLEVNRFTIDSAFRSNGLVFRKSDSRYVTSYYTTLLQVPAEVFTEETRDWLSSSGLYGMVLEAGSTLHPTHILEGHIIDYYVDDRPMGKPSAVLKVETVLIKQGDEAGHVIQKGFYEATEPLKASSGEEAVVALARCTEKVLGLIEADLARATY